MFNTVFKQLIGELKSHPFTLLSVVALIFMTSWGYTAYAQADNVDLQISTLALKVERNGQKIDRVQKLLLAESIRGVQRQICKTTNHAVNSQLQRTLETLQEDYAAINFNRRYLVTRCEQKT